jgi:hypothetical protein
VPPDVTRVALANARFHCPQTLFAWYAITQGKVLCAAAVTRKTPKYCTAAESTQTRRHNPQMPCKLFHMINGPLVRYLSPIHPWIYIYTPAKKKGGVLNTCDKPTLNPILLFKIIGRKNVIEYEITVLDLKSS